MPEGRLHTKRSPELIPESEEGLTDGDRLLDNVVLVKTLCVFAGR